LKVHRAAARGRVRDVDRTQRTARKRSPDFSPAKCLLLEIPFEFFPENYNYANRGET